MVSFILQVLGILGAIGLGLAMLFGVVIIGLSFYLLAVLPAIIVPVIAILILKWKKVL